MWLHAGVFHVLANMLSLVFIGIRLEQEFGFEPISFNFVPHFDFDEIRIKTQMGFLGLNPNFLLKTKKTKKREIFMERGQPAAPSSLEIKVVSPRRSDNVVHPAGQPPETTTPRQSFSDYSPLKRWVSWLVPSIVVANIVVFVVTMFVNDCPKNSDTCIGRFLGRLSFQPFKENHVKLSLFYLLGCGLWGTAGVAANPFVRKDGCSRRSESGSSTPGMAADLIGEQRKEFIHRRWGSNFSFRHIRIGFLYLMSGFGGSLLSALFIQYGIYVGASGALFGLLGSMLSELISNWTVYVNKLAALLTFLFIIIINLAVGILPHVDNFALIGGFFNWLTQRNAPPGCVTTPVKSKHKTYQYVLWVLSLILSVVYTLGLVTLFRGVNLNNHCSWCHYLSSVPTSKWNCESQNIYCLVN
ncbi:unnamed protein product [Malus baccata var. baccata]